MANLVDKLCIISGIAAKPELNGTLAMVVSYDESSGRCEASPVNNVAHHLGLRPEKLAIWIETTPPTGDDLPTQKDIEKASASELIEYMKMGCLLTLEKNAAYGCILRNLRIPIKKTGRELYMEGGAIEMMVQSIHIHKSNRPVLHTLLMGLGMTCQACQAGADLSIHMRDQAIAAGALPLIEEILSLHVSSDIQCAALALVYAVSTGWPEPRSEKRKEAAASLISAVVGALELSPHKTAIQHFGIQAIGGIIEMTGPEFDSASAARADLAMESGAHKVIIEAMMRYGHMPTENGQSHHDIETVCIEGVTHERVGTESGVHGDECSGQGGDAAAQDEMRPAKATLTLPGSILLSGAIALLGFVYQDDTTTKDERIKALNDAGALKAIAFAMRENPQFCNLDGSKKFELADKNHVLQLVAILLGREVVEATLMNPPSDGVNSTYHDRINELMDDETKQILIGSVEVPGLLLEKFFASVGDN